MFQFHWSPLSNVGCCLCSRGPTALVQLGSWMPCLVSSYCFLLNYIGRLRWVGRERWDNIVGKLRSPAAVPLIACFISSLLPFYLGGIMGQRKEELENVTEETGQVWLPWELSWALWGENNTKKVWICDSHIFTSQSLTGSTSLRNRFTTCADFEGVWGCCELALNEWSLYFEKEE